MKTEWIKHPFRLRMQSTFVTVLVALTLLAGCVQQPLPASPGEWWIRTELFFGLSKPDGTLVSAEQWNDFLDHQVTPRFPDGLTVIEARGQYADVNKALYKEPARLVIVLYPRAQGGDANGKILSIAAEYCERFQQESVLRVDSLQKTTFLSGKRSAHDAAVSP